MGIVNGQPCICQLVGDVVPNYRGWKSLTIASRSFTSTESLSGHVHSHSRLLRRTGSFPYFSSLIFGFVAHLMARLREEVAQLSDSRFNALDCFATVVRDQEVGVQIHSLRPLL